MDKINFIKLEGRTNEDGPDVYKKIIISNEEIDSIMNMALSDGISYWCSKWEIIESKHPKEKAAHQISKEGKLRLYNFKNEASYVLTKSNFLNAIKIAFEKFPEWFDMVEVLSINNAVKVTTYKLNKKTEYYIGDSLGDFIVQLALFGEIIY